MNPTISLVTKVEIVAVDRATAAEKTKEIGLKDSR